MLSIEKKSRYIDSLKDVESPFDIDNVTDSLGIPPSLVNVHLAAKLDFSEFGLGECIYLPVQISKKDGGRKSLYFLHPGEKVFCGILVNSDGIALRYVTRETGEVSFARDGDVYNEEYRALNGQWIVRMKGVLKILDEKRGYGELRDIEFQSQDGKSQKATKIIRWWAWSFYAELE